MAKAKATPKDDSQKTPPKRAPQKRAVPKRPSLRDLLPEPYRDLIPDHIPDKDVNIFLSGVLHGRDNTDSRKLEASIAALWERMGEVIDGLNDNTTAIMRLTSTVPPANAAPATADSAGPARPARPSVELARARRAAGAPSHDSQGPGGLTQADIDRVYDEARKAAPENPDVAQAAADRYLDDHEEQLGSRFPMDLHAMVQQHLHPEDAP